MRQYLLTIFLFSSIIACSSEEYAPIDQEVHLQGISGGGEVCKYIDFPGRVVDLSIKDISTTPSCVDSYSSKILGPDRNRIKICTEYGRSCTRGSMVDGRFKVTGCYLK